MEEYIGEYYRGYSDIKSLDCSSFKVAELIGLGGLGLGLQGL